MAPVSEDVAPGSGTWLAVEGETLVGADFSGRELVSFTGIGATFVNCRFEKLNVMNMGFGHGRVRSYYRNCTFDGSVLVAGGADHVRLESCSFRNVKISGWESREFDLIDCVFSGILRRCLFDGRVSNVFGKLVEGREGNEIVGNDFSQASLHGVWFSGGIDLTKQRLPGGPKYLYLPDAVAAIKEARSFIATLPEDEIETGRIFLKMFERLAETGQRQQFFRTSDCLRGSGHAGEKVVEFWRTSSLAAEPDQ